MTDWVEQIQQARRKADELHDRAMLLGYNASFNIGGELDEVPDVLGSACRSAGRYRGDLHDCR